MAGTVSRRGRRTAAGRTATVHAQASQVELLTVERIKPWFIGAMINRVVDCVIVDLADATTLASGKHIKTTEQRQSQKDSHGRPFQNQPPSCRVRVRFQPRGNTWNFLSRFENRVPLELV